jgi:hypothetical protein
VRRRGGEPCEEYAEIIVFAQGRLSSLAGVQCAARGTLPLRRGYTP